MPLLLLSTVYDNTLLHVLNLLTLCIVVFMNSKLNRIYLYIFHFECLDFKHYSFYGNLIVLV